MKRAAVVLASLSAWAAIPSIGAGATLAAGHSHTVVIRASDGTVWAWGANNYGQLGDSSNTERRTPVQTSALTGIVGVAAGANHTLALRSDGTVWAWGDSQYGQLGDGTSGEGTSRTAPVQLTASGFTNIVAIAAGDNHSLALKNDGTVWTWGRNDQGQLATGGTAERNTPTAVVGLNGVVAIGAGGGHTIVILSNGRMKAWGLNESGQLGDGTTSSPALNAVSVSRVTTATTAAGGAAHTLTLLSDGTLVAWGLNEHGQLGDDSTSEETTAGAVSGLAGVMGIATGSQHSLAVMRDGAVSAWGRNQSGQVGDGTSGTDRLTPVPLNLTGIIQVGAGRWHSVAVSADGTVWAWGQNDAGQLGDGTTANREEPFKVSEAGFAWKAATPTFSPAGNTYFQNTRVTISCATEGATIRYTTDGTDPDDSSPVYSRPVSIRTTTTLKAVASKDGLSDSNVASAAYTLKVATPTFTPAPGILTGTEAVTIVSTSRGATIHYTEDGTEPSSDSALYAGPVLIETTTVLKAKAFKAGWIDSDTATGSYAMNLGTLAAPTISPATGTYRTSVDVTISAAPFATIRYTTNGSDPTSGSSVYTGPLTLTATTTLKARAFHPDFVASATASETLTIPGTTSSFNPPNDGTESATYGLVAAGDRHSIVAVPDSQAWAFGSNYSGELGDGTTTPRYVPAPVSSLSGLIALSAGNSVSAAVKADGTLWMWGSNGYGQLGDGTTTSRLVPQQVSTLSGITAVSVGTYHTLALKSDGTVWAWGTNPKGQLGDGTTTQRLSPVQVTTLSGVVAIAAGGNHSLAVKSDGTAWAWGYNNNGQVGDGTSGTGSDRWSPVKVDGLSSLTAVAAATNDSYALRDDGSVWAWGANTWGELGDGTILQRVTPVGVLALSDITAIAAGSCHAMALKSDGTVLTWGCNGWGQVGDGTQDQRHVAAAIASLADVVAIGSGSSADHSLAITSDGSVWGWGYNGMGSLGDGTQVSALSPIRISDPAFAWKVATPTLSVISGTYYANFNVTVATLTAGATIHYTTNGVDPTEADPVVASGSTVLVDQTMTLKAKAWKTGVPASNVASRDYTMQVAQPVANPGGGLYTVPKTVTLTSTTSGALIRYTTDGSTPTESSTLYTAPITISTTTTLKVIGVKTNWSASTVLTQIYTMSFGTAATPTASPTAGTYTTSVDVTLSCTTSGATIRYTTDGSTPSGSSPAYTAPLTLAATTTLKAKAFHPDYTASGVLTATYTIELAAPTITPTSGTYAAGTEATISSSVAGGTIRYTTNGVDPTTADAVIPSGATVTLLSSVTLKAKVWKTGNNPSAVTAVTYTITGQVGSGKLGAGGTHSLVLKPDGAVWSFGRGDSGQLGDGTTTSKSYPVAASTLTSMTAIAGGDFHTLALRNDGLAFAVGANATGQLGDGTTTQRTNPVQVSTLTGVSAVGAGTEHSLAAKSDGTAWAWGKNAAGQLGDGTTTLRKAPVQVSTITGITAVAGGMEHSLALKSDGTVWAWGLNTYGQLGDGTTTQRLTPVQVSSLTGVTAIAAGTRHSFALKSDGTMWAWGLNNQGQLGDGTNTQRNSPVQILSAVIAMAGGGSQGLAAKADGTLWVWGTTTTGTDPKSPALVDGPDGVIAVAAGGSHSIALTSTGEVWTWGVINAYGQFGDGTVTPRNYALKVAEASFSWKAGLPQFSPSTGNYATTQTVTLTCATPGTTIHYTTDGADPTTSDPSVASGGTVSVTQSLTLKALAVKAGLSDSYVRNAVYTLGLATPTASPVGSTYNTDQNVSLSTTSPGATIRYTLDGTSPTEASPVYATPITVDHTMTIKAKAFRTGWTPSADGYAPYVMKVGMPTLSPAGGAYTSAQTVTVSTVTPGSILHYTTSGLEPTESDPIVTSGSTVTVSQSATLKVRGWKAGGWTQSDVRSGTYTISQGALATPTFSPAAGTYTSAQVVAISTTSPGATIRYTTDGTDPTLTSKLYLAPITVDWSTTVKARAFKADWGMSAVGTAAYTINLSNTVAPATFSPGPGSYTTTQTVTLTSATSGATIHYTTNGAVPTESDPSVASGGTVSVDRGLSLKAKAFATGMTASPTRRADYAVTGAVEAAWAHGLALKVDRTLWAWGYNVNGQVGNGTTTTVTTPVQVLTGAVAVSAVGDAAPRGHTLAVKADGTVWGWGDNGSGQIGDGTTTQRTSPVQTSTAGGTMTGVVAVSAGAFHTLALTSTGQVWGWGENGNGEVGDGTQTDRLTPVQVTTLSDVVAVAAGQFHSMALKRDGTVWTWGNNSFGQLGDGTANQHSTPTQVPSLTGVVAISVGIYHCVALKTDGTATGDVWSWGNNQVGQVGDGTSDNRPSPVRVFMGARGVSGNDMQSLYLQTDAMAQGSIWGTGGHHAADLTPGAPASSKSPIRVGDGDYVAAAPGAGFSLALRRDTSVVAWPDAYPAANGMVLGYATGDDDPDQDGLTTNQEWQIGTDPWNADTNGDGIPDGAAVASGKSPTDVDMDGDGASNATETAQGTDPFNSDTDGDTVVDGADCFPLDPTRSTCPPSDPNDHTPPIITLTEPTNATLISVVPPL